VKSPLAVMPNCASFEWLLWQQRLIGVNLNNTVRLPDPENWGVGKHSEQLSFTGTELYRLEVPIGRNANF